MSAPGNPNSSSIWRLLALVAILALGGWLGLRIASGTNRAPQGASVASVRTAKVTIGPIERTLRISGQTSSSEFQNITAPIMRGPESGRELILLFLIKSGVRVKKGEMLAQIDAQSLQDHLDDLQATIEQAESDIRKRRAEQAIDWENLEQTLRVARAELNKVKLDASAAEVRTSIDQELLKLGVEEAEARFKQIEADVAFKQISQKAEIRILEITKDRHVRHDGRHKNDHKRFTITTPLDGLAVVQPTFRGGEWSLIQQGDQVFPGQLFLKVVNPERMQVEATINQAESGLFRIGQTARINLDAFPGLQFKGKIFSIGALASGGFRQGFYIRNVPVRIAIEGSDPRLIPDLSAGVDVILDRVEKVKRIPLAAVREEQGRRVVYVRQGQSAQRRVVELGLANSIQVAVLSGLEEGEEVLLEPPARPS